MEDSRFIQLITQKLNDELTQEEERELRSLLDHSESYAQRYKSFMEYWNCKETDHANSHRLFTKLTSKIPDLEDSYGQANDETPVVRPRKLWPGYLFKAAAIITCILTGLLFYYKSNKDREYLSVVPRKIATSLTAIKVITLEDGSNVKLNGNSTLSNIKMFSDHREITLNGEGFFNIAKDAKRPFTIHTSKMDIRVLGTSFNVRAYTDEELQETVLIHGAIKVTLHNKKHSVILMKPNDKLTVEIPKPAGKAVAPPDVRKYTLSKVEHYENDSAMAVIETAWTNNHLVFRDEPFDILAHRLEVRYGVNIVFNNSKLRELRFNGTFKKENLQDVLYVLSRTGNPFTYKINGREVYIY